MENCNLLSKNLKSYQNFRELSLYEFSQELNIPKSTLRSILKEGNTTLETMIQISKALDISIDMLVLDKDMPDKLFIMKNIEKANNWLSTLSDDKKHEIASLISKIWEVI